MCERRKRVNERKTFRVGLIRYCQPLWKRTTIYFSPKWGTLAFYNRLPGNFTAWRIPSRTKLLLMKLYDESRRQTDGRVFVINSERLAWNVECATDWNVFNFPTSIPLCVHGLRLLWSLTLTAMHADRQGCICSSSSPTSLHSSSY